MASPIASSSQTSISTPSSSTTFLSAPEAAFVAPDSRSRPQDAATNMVDDFFGASQPHAVRGTLESRHDQPPPYARFSFVESTTELPSYGEHSAHSKEPPTLAMYLFKYGFVFPLFWLAGAFILFSTLRAPEDWESGKSEQERTEMLRHISLIERKWAKRCALAFSIFAVLIAVLVLAVFAVIRWT